MHILETLAPVDAPRGSAVALGFFDGVHLGHRTVLQAAVDYAAEKELTPAAFTFLLPPGSASERRPHFLCGGETPPHCLSWH